VRTSTAPAAALLALALALLGPALAGCTPTAPRLPPGFPSTVPVLGGDVIASKHEYGEWYVWVRSAHPLEAYRTARALLLKAGYDETANDETAGGSTGQFCSPKWCSNLTGYHDPRYGDSVSYEVFATTGFNAVH
jgi:hypothetical protein